MAFILIAFVLAIATAAAAGIANMRYGWLVGGGIAAGVLPWLAAAVNIYRGPDNPELGEAGWTVVTGFVIGVWVLAWVGGATVGKLLRPLVIRGARRPPTRTPVRREPGKPRA